MPLQNFVDYVGPKISAAWLNTVDALKFTVFADAATKAAARTALMSDAPLEVANGGTGSRLGITTSYTITDAEIAAAVTPTNYAYPPGDVRRYGAVGNGTTDDSAAIQAAFNLPHPVVLQPTTYRIDTGLTWNLDYGVIHANAAIFTTAQDIIGLTIGALGSNNVLQGCRIIGGLYLINTGGASTKPGFEFRQVYEGKFDIGAQGWEKGIHLTSSAHGTVYNQFYLGRITNNNYGLHLNPTSEGWVNENNFYGGRWARLTGSGQYLVYAPDSGSTYGRPNSNKFFGCSLENSVGATLVGAVYDEGIQNAYYSPRIELQGTVTDIAFKIGPRAIACVLILPHLTYQSTTSTGTNVSDLGAESIIWTIDQFKMVSRQAAPASAVMELWRQDGNNNGTPTQQIVCAYDDSQTSMGTLYRVARSVVDDSGYILKAVTMGTIRKAASGKEYECILSHTSAAADEPEVGGSWTTYWRRLPTHQATNVTWSAAQVYTGPVDRAEIGSAGEADFRTLTIRDAAVATSAGDVQFGTSTQTTVGAAGAATALPAQPTGYLRFFIGATEFVMPYYASV